MMGRSRPRPAATRPSVLVLGGRRLVVEVLDRVATVRFARASSGITTIDTASSTRPTGELSGASPAMRSRTPSMVT
jgi:hypothetical protein